MRKHLCFATILLAASAPMLLADEGIRQVQEELRKRNLYFGNVDGQSTSDLANAVKLYQARKGFQVTGEIDSETATSLNIRAAALATKKQGGLPDLPVLKSDAAREISEAQRIALQGQPEVGGDSSRNAIPPAESPAPSQNVPPERINEFVDDYLRDAQSDDVAAQVNYYSYPVEYFDHGSVPRDFVERDTRNYVKRWPERKYMLTESPTFAASGNDTDTVVEFTIVFSVRSGKQAATGRTRNVWRIRPEGGKLKIVAIREQRLRE